MRAHMRASRITGLFVIDGLVPGHDAPIAMVRGRGHLSAQNCTRGTRATESHVGHDAHHVAHAVGYAAWAPQVCVAEKGCMELELSIDTQEPGHAAAPPKETAIGILVRQANCIAEPNQSSPPAIGLKLAAPRGGEACAADGYAALADKAPGPGPGAGLGRQPRSPSWSAIPCQGAQAAPRPAFCPRSQPVVDLIVDVWVVFGMHTHTAGPKTGMCGAGVLACQAHGRRGAQLPRSHQRGLQLP